MDGLPQEFCDQIDQLGVGVSLSQCVQIGHNFLKKFEEVASFFLGDGELEGGGYSDQDLHHCNKVLISLDFRHDSINWKPGFVLMANDNSNDFLIEFDELITFGASDHCQDQDFLDLLFLFRLDLETLGFPMTFNRVLQLDQGCLLCVLVCICIVHDLHQSHAVT